MQRVLITGASGLIGRQLKEMLLRSGDYQVISVSTNASLVDNKYVFHWDVKRGWIDERALDGVDHIVHLAGASLSSARWTAKRKKELYESRVRSAELLFDVVKKKQVSLRSFISSSATGYYGGGVYEKVFCVEESIPGKTFPAKLCVDWENAAKRFAALGCQVVQVRTGVVFSADGGALPVMAKPVRWGLGAVLGAGNQCVPWIHIQDLLRLYQYVLQLDSFSGVINAVAPDAVTNEVLIRSLAAKLGKPLWFPYVPSFLLRFLMGEMSQIVLEGKCVSSEKARRLGFSFLYPKIEEALDDLL